MVFESSDGDMGIVRQRAVVLETDNDGNFVLRENLEEGIEIVVAGAKGLSDGQSVRRFSGFSN